MAFNLVRESEIFGLCCKSFIISTVTTVALASQKGGVGKTTISVNLSFSFAKRGWRVLLVDADLQGGVGFSLTERAKEAQGYYDLLLAGDEISKATLEQTIIETRLPELSLITRGSRDALDAMLQDSHQGGTLEERIGSLHSMLEEQEYDLILYDTPTGVGAVTMGVSSQVDYMMVPERPDPLCLRSLPQILRMIAAVRSGSRADGGPRLAGFVLAISDPEDPTSLQDQKEFRDLLPADMVFETVIPEHRDFREASRKGVPVAMLRQRPSASSLVFDQLAAEAEERMFLYEEGETPTDGEEDYARLVD